MPCCRLWLSARGVVVGYFEAKATGYLAGGASCFSFTLAGARARESKIATGVQGAREVWAGDVSFRGYSHSPRHCDLLGKARQTKVDVCTVSKFSTEGPDRRPRHSYQQPLPLSDAVGLHNMPQTRPSETRRQPILFPCVKISAGQMTTLCGRSFVRHVSMHARAQPPSALPGRDAAEQSCLIIIAGPGCRSLLDNAECDVMVSVLVSCP